MFRSRTPAVLLDQQTAALKTQLDGVYDGDAEAVHRARVATRRIRELLGLLRVHGGNSERDVVDSYQQVGRALGKVRDIDVQVGLIRSLEAHGPDTAVSLAVVRQAHEHDRLSKMRRLIKTLERLNVDTLLGAMTNGHPITLWSRLHSGTWRQQLRRLALERAHAGVESIAHSTGVYFPNRVHATRIAIKQLRYAAEIAEGTGLSDLREAIKELRKGQEVLGDLHDRQSLCDTLFEFRKRDGVDPGHIKLVSRVLEAEVLALHSQYLGRRAALAEACAEIERGATSTLPRASGIAVGGAMAVSGLVYATRRWQRPEPVHRATRKTA